MVRALEGVFLAWGETARWDERRRRLYCVDCAGHVLAWMDGGEQPLATLGLPSMPTGMALAEDGRLVVALEDGLHRWMRRPAPSSSSSPTPRVWEAGPTT